MSKIYINLSNGMNIEELDKKIANTYSTTKEGFTFVFDVTKASAANLGNIGKLIKLIDKYKGADGALKQVDIVCPKNQIVKRGIIKKCVKMAKSKKPIYLVEKA